MPVPQFSTQGQAALFLLYIPGPVLVSDLYDKINDRDRFWDDMISYSMAALGFLIFCLVVKWRGRGEAAKVRTKKIIRSGVLLKHSSFFKGTAGC